MLRLRGFDRRQLAPPSLTERAAVAGRDRAGEFVERNVARQLAHHFGRRRGVIHAARQRAVGIDAFQIVHQFFHPAVMRNRRLENHRARRVSLESAHRNLALLKRYRVAPGVETFDADRAHRSQNSARVAIHDLIGFQVA